MRSKIITSLLVTSFFLLLSQVYAAPQFTQVFQASYNRSGSDDPAGIFVNTNHEVYVAGSSVNPSNRKYEGKIIKYDPNGVKIGESVGLGGSNRGTNTDHFLPAVYNNPNNGQIYGALTQLSPFKNGFNDSAIVRLNASLGANGTFTFRNMKSIGLCAAYTFDATAITVDQDNYVYVAGNLWKGCARSLYETVIIKLKSNLDFVLFPSGAPALYLNRNSINLNTITSLAVDSSGNIYASGYTYAAGGDYDWIVAKYNANGNLAWTRMPNLGFGYDVASSVAIHPNGDVYVAGFRNASLIANANNFVGEIWIVRYDPANGSIKDETVYNSTPAGAYDLALDQDGNIYVSGATSAGAFAAKYASSLGQPLWTSYQWGFSAGLSAPALAVDNAGSVYLAGFDLSRDTSGRSNAPRRTSDFLVTKVAETSAPALLSASLSADPNTGAAPLNGVQLTAAVVGATGSTIDYSFNCGNGTTFAINTSGNTYTTTGANTCNYSTPQTYYAQVIAQDNGAGGTGLTGVSPFVPIDVQPGSGGNPPNTGTYTVTLRAAPSAGRSPLNGVDLVSTLNQAPVGAVQYTFDCGNGVTKIVSDTAVSHAEANMCDYPTPGTYTARVSAQGTGWTANGTARVSVLSGRQECPPSATECTP